jgi:hypothetical protein
VIDAPGSTEKPEREGGQGSGPNPTEKWAARASGEADAPRSRGGRPRGSRDKKPRKRPPLDRGRGRFSSSELSDTETVPPPPPPTEAEIIGVGKLLGTSWRLLGGRFRRRPLDPLEERQLAEAAIPVLSKYGGGFLEQWGAELSLGIVAIGLWDSTRIPDAPATSSSAAMIEDGDVGVP